MELSLFLAKAIGIGLMLIAASMLVNRKNIDLLFEAYRSPSAVYITGIVETFLGIDGDCAQYMGCGFPAHHHAHRLDALAARGGADILSFEHRRMLERFRVMDSTFAPLLVAIFLIGAYLAYAGFTG